MGKVIPVWSISDIHRPKEASRAIYHPIPIPVRRGKAVIFGPSRRNWLAFPSRALMGNPLARNLFGPSSLESTKFGVNEPQKYIDLSPVCE